MPKLFLDPFSSDRPVDNPNFFAGRLQEFNEIIQYLYNTAHDFPKHVLITGDRGIGKSSMLRQTRHIAEGTRDLADKLRSEYGDSVVDPPAFNFVTVWHSADSGQNAETFAHTLIAAAKTEVERFFGNFSIEINWFVNIKQGTQQNVTAIDLANQFCKTVKKAAEKVRKERKSGILFFIDETDTFPQNSGVGIFMKNVVDSLCPNGITNVAFVMAGITGALQRLMIDHDSISRSFHEVNMSPLSLEEGAAILRKGFDLAKITYDEDVINQAFAISAGYPEPLHLLGSALLSVNNTGHLTQQDLAAAKKKILRNTRHSVLQDRLVKAGSSINQRILEAMSMSEDSVVTTDFIRSKVSKPSDEISAGIRDLIDRKVITKEEKGEYRITDPLLREFIAENGVIDANEPSTKHGDLNASPLAE
jgi:hypothetical protein